MKYLRPFEPTAERPWDLSAANHLLRRAGFSPSPEESQAALRDGLKATVDRLVHETSDSDRHGELDETGRALAIRQQIEPLRGWWLLRMCHTRRVLHARMGLFWHNHFATSNTKVESPALMLQQHRTIERHALGRFDELLLELSRDPAMIVWLDGNANAKGRPNENYARELFELFSLGVGHYSEQDIREAARAFTGWHVRAGVFRFLASEHDAGEKRVFGERGNFDGGDIVRLAVAQPACARFLAAKLLREFLCPNPPDDLIDELAEELRATHFDLAATLMKLFGSAVMFDPRWYRARIKSPVELAVGLVRSLGLRLGAAALSDAVSQAGQRLFEPPSVKGWDGHRAWLNAATMLVRLNAATQAVSGEAFRAAEFRARNDLVDRERGIRACEALTLDNVVPDGLRKAYPDTGTDIDEAVRGALRVLLTAPEYQMA